MTCALRDAVTKNTHTPEGLGAFILAARDCRDTPSAVKLVAPEHLSTYKVILDEVVASQDDIESRSVTATLLNDTATSDYVQRCVDLIDRHVPHDLVELSTFANTVVAFDHPDVSGTSVAGATGLIFIRPEDRTIDTIDHLIHEWSHNKFETILHTHRLWTDDERLHHSPIRGTPRPLYGVFHAIYVLLVVSEAMVHLMHVDELGDDASRKIDSFVTECDASLRALSDEPSLTEHGHKFVDLCLHWAETISKERSAA
uniref:HEXXH motif domain-containing protein n=1 Tax=Mycolicibacterium neoaurum VKM Ac-1815D TaxID=700508 RepID=V5XIC4_MYCNE